jgi:hypothetical protein
MPLSASVFYANPRYTARHQQAAATAGRAHENIGDRR